MAFADAATCGFPRLTVPSAMSDLSDWSDWSDKSSRETCVPAPDLVFRSLSILGILRKKSAGKLTRPVFKLK